MKTKEAVQFNFSEITGSEITSLGGGDGFAYDAGAFLRFCGIYIANGMGGAGYATAVGDAVANYIINEK